MQDQIIDGREESPASTDPCAEQTVTAGTIDEMETALSKAYGDVTVRLGPPNQGLSMKLTTYNLNNVALGKLQLTNSTVNTARYPWFAVCLPVEGEIRVKTQRGSTWVARNQGAVVNPGEAVQVDYDAEFNAMQTVVFDRTGLEAELALMLGRSPKDPLTFDFGIGAFRNSAFARTLALLPNELAHPGGLAHVPALASRLGRLLMASLLSSHHHNFSAELSDPNGRSRPRTVRTAIDAIQHDPVAIETVADIAKSAGLSVRALDEGFRKYVGISPMKYLRQVKLARVHDALLGADPEATTATAVARQWGFLHYGRFAAEYREAFGRTPSASLKATRND